MNEKIRKRLISFVTMLMCIIALDIWYIQETSIVGIIFEIIGFALIGWKWIK
jgi:accessory gene regulator protein AgrB